jgi:hypothetical protein
MNVTALPAKETPLVIHGAPGLTIQMGTIALAHAAAGDGWDHGQIDQVVFELPNDPPGRIIEATATAAPASIGYWPHGIDLSPADLHAFGRVGGGFGDLPVRSRTGVRPKLPSAAWSVERTQVLHDLNTVRLIIDLAVWGPTTLMRLAYSVFVVTMPLTSANATTHVFPNP